MKLTLFILISFLITACPGLPGFFPPLSNNLPLCFSYEWDREKKIWTDDKGQQVQCTIFDEKNLYPPLALNCDFWEETLNFTAIQKDKFKQEGERPEYKVELQRVRVHGQWACLRQDVIQLGSEASLQGHSSKFCLIRTEDAFEISLCS